MNAICALTLVLTTEEAADALDAVRATAHSEGRSIALAGLLPRLSDKRRELATVEVTGSLHDVQWSRRIDVLTTLSRSGPLTRTVVETALSATREIGDPIFRSQALAALLPGLGDAEQPAIATEAFGLLQETIHDPTRMVVPLDRLEILFSLAPWRSALPRWSDLFHVAYALSYAHWRAQAQIRLANLEPADSGDHLALAIANGAARDRAWERHEAWSGLADIWVRLPTAERQYVWNAGLRSLAERPRSDLLLDIAFLACMTPAIGGATPVVGVMNSIEEACGTWP